MNAEHLVEITQSSGTKCATIASTEQGGTRPFLPGRAGVANVREIRMPPRSAGKKLCTAAFDAGARYSSTEIQLHARKAGVQGVSTRSGRRFGDGDASKQKPSVIPRFNETREDFSLHFSHAHSEAHEAGHRLLEDYFLLRSQSGDQRLRGGSDGAKEIRDGSSYCAPYARAASSSPCGAAFSRSAGRAGSSFEVAQ